MGNALFDVLLTSVCKYYIENFCVYVYWGNLPIILFFFFFWYQGTVSFLKGSVWSEGVSASSTGPKYKLGLSGDIRYTLKSLAWVLFFFSVFLLQAKLIDFNFSVLLWNISSAVQVSVIAKAVYWVKGPGKEHPDLDLTPSQNQGQEKQYH